MPALCRTLWKGEKLNDVARDFDFCFIFFEIKLKASVTLVNSDEYTITKKIF
jgi:hypothetical protein